MSIRELKRNEMTTDMRDIISMVYFNNIHEYYPIKAIHIVKIDIGLIGKDIDVDILQALNMYDIHSRNFIEFLYAGDENDIDSILLKHQDALVRLIRVLSHRLKTDVVVASDCDESTPYVLNRIIHSDSKNITITEVFEME